MKIISNRKYKRIKYVLRESHNALMNSGTLGDNNASVADDIRQLGVLKHK